MRNYTHIHIHTHSTINNHTQMAHVRAVGLRLDLPNRWDCPLVLAGKERRGPSANGTPESPQPGGWCALACSIIVWLRYAGGWCAVVCRCVGAGGWGLARTMHGVHMGLFDGSSLTSYGQICCMHSFSCMYGLFGRELSEHTVKYIACTASL